MPVNPRHIFLHFLRLFSTRRFVISSLFSAAAIFTLFCFHAMPPFSLKQSASALASADVTQTPCALSSQPRR